MRRPVPPPRRAPDPRDPDRHRRLVELFEAHHTAVLGYLSRRSATPELAADAFSDVFLVAWRRLDDVPDGDAARLWLLAVARRSLANGRRASRRRAGLAERLAGSLPRSAFVVPPPEAPDGRLRAALAQLAPDDAELLRLIGWEGLTPTQAAAVLELTPGLARVRLHRARARLRALLAAEGEDGEDGWGGEQGDRAAVDEGGRRAVGPRSQRSAPPGHSQQRRAPARLVGEEAT